ncbi:MAG TPA: HD-GYP domain-containing protein [Anaerolineales bacterium]|nr:HD-GYP domain-containing protein [Anaerolineales bacterium]
MQTTAASNTISAPRKHPRYQIQWVHLYTSAIAVIGLLIFLHALRQAPADLIGMGVFVIMAVVVELASVELFQSSRSQVSMSSAIAIASILALGPWAGVITYFASAATTALTAALRNPANKPGRFPLFRRTLFNAGMWAIAAAAAGMAYLLAGGSVVTLQSFSSIPALMLATVVEWLFNAVILVGVISLQTGESVLTLWKRDIRWQAPVSIAGGILGGGFLALSYGMYGMFGVLIVLLPILSTSYAFRAYKNNMQVYVEELETLNEELKDALTALEKSNVELTGALSALEKSNLELTCANESIRRLNAELFHSLAKVFDMRDPYVGGHAAQVAVYAVAIAAEMGLPPERIELVRQAAYLHDIGKLSIPEAILHKPGKLTETEYEFVKKHTDIGADLLSSVEGLKHLAPYVRHHHERWDGHGYPMGLGGEEIPLEARILNVCDSVETMASDRPYHRGMSMQAIIEEVRRCSGTQFDPLVAETFVTLVQLKSPNDFIINSARSVTQQYAATILANEYLTQNMFAWVLERGMQQ